MKDIKIEIDSKDLLGMLSKYYTELLKEEVKVEARLETTYKGYGINEHEETEVNLTYAIKHNLDGAVLKVNNTLDYEDVKRALSTILGKIGYSVEDFVYKTEATGYGRDEEEFFNGVEVKVTKKGIEMKLEQ